MNNSSIKSISAEDKKRIATEFYIEFVVNLKFDLEGKYIGKSYRQHNPMIADGIEGLKAFAAHFKGLYPEVRVDFKKVFVDGDYVITHSNVFLQPNSRGMAVVDIFRFEGDKVVEHWDVIQEVPAESMNSNTMF